MKNKSCCFTGVCLVGISLLLASLSFSTMATEATTEAATEAVNKSANQVLTIQQKLLYEKK